MQPPVHLFFYSEFDRTVSSRLREMRSPVMTGRNSSPHPHEWPEGLKAWAAFKKPEEALRGIIEFLSQEDYSDYFLDD